jgi:hypothetical protein
MRAPRRVPLLRARVCAPFNSRAITRARTACTQNHRVCVFANSCRLPVASPNVTRQRCFLVRCWRSCSNKCERPSSRLPLLFGVTRAATAARNARCTRDAWPRHTRVRRRSAPPRAPRAACCSVLRLSFCCRFAGTRRRANPAAVVGCATRSVRTRRRRRAARGARVMRGRGAPLCGGAPTVHARAPRAASAARACFYRSGQRRLPLHTLFFNVLCLLNSRRHHSHLAFLPARKTPRRPRFPLSHTSSPSDTTACARVRAHVRSRRKEAEHTTHARAQANQLETG